MTELSQWQLALLRCGKCKRILHQSGNSLMCSSCAFSLVSDGAIWRDWSLPNAAPRNPCGNIDYAQRAILPFTSTAREERQYRSHIQRIVAERGPCEIGVDFGCGDGRFTQWLLSLGVLWVVAIDIDLANLKRLEEKLRPDELQRVLLLQADVSWLPLETNSCDFVFAIGVLNLFDTRFEHACRKLHEIIRPNGTLINSEPTLEGSLLYALVRHDVNEFLQVAQTNTKTIDIESEQATRVPVLEQKEVKARLQRVGFKLLWTKGISVLPSLVFGGVLRMGDYSEQTKRMLVNAVDDLARRDPPVYRVVMYVSQKSSV